MAILENNANNEVGRRAWKSLGSAHGAAAASVRPCSFGGQQPQRRCGASAAAAVDDRPYHDGGRVIEVCNLNQ